MKKEDYVYGYWGKAQSSTASGQPWHPLAYHSLDVAAVADAILDRSPRKLARMAALCGTTPETLKRFLVVLIALHDIGKYSRHFQAKSDIGWQTKVLGVRPAPPAGVRHDAIGYAMLDQDRLDIERTLRGYPAARVVTSAASSRILNGAAQAACALFNIGRDTHGVLSNCALRFSRSFRRTPAAQKGAQEIAAPCSPQIPRRQVSHRGSATQHTR